MNASIRKSFNWGVGGGFQPHLRKNEVGTLHLSIAQFVAFWESLSNRLECQKPSDLWYLCKVFREWRISVCAKSLLPWYKVWTTNVGVCSLPTDDVSQCHSVTVSQCHSVTVSDTLEQGTNYQTSSHRLVQGCWSTLRSSALLSSLRRFVHVIRPWE